MGALYYPTRATAQNRGIIVLHDFAADSLSQPVLRLAGGLAQQGYVTLAPNMSHHDDEYLRNSARFDDNLTEIAGAIRHMERQGVDEVFLLGIGFGALDALSYCLKTTDCGPGGRVRGIGHYGTMPPGLPDMGAYVGIDANDQAEALRTARQLVDDSLPHAYLIGTGIEWLIQAGRLVNYFDPDGPAGAIARLARSSNPPTWTVRDDEDWVIRTTQEVERVSGASPSPTGGAFTPTHSSLTPCRQTNGVDNISVDNELVFRQQTGDVLGVVYRPADPRLRNSTAIVVAHGSDGGTLFDWPSYAISRCLAVRDYTVFALNGRDAGAQFPSSRLETSALTFDDGYAYLTNSLGFRSVYLYAHSSTTVPLLHFIAQRGTVTPEIRGVILGAAIDSTRDLQLAHTRQEDLEQALQLARRSVRNGLVNRWLAIPWCGWDNPIDGWCWRGEHWVVLSTAEHALSYYDSLSVADGRQDIQTVTTPILFLRSQADMVATCDRSLALFRRASSAPNVSLVEFSGQRANGEWLTSREAHGLQFLETSSATAIDDWITNGGQQPLPILGTRTRVLWRGSNPLTEREFEASRCMFPEEFFALKDQS